MVEESLRISERSYSILAKVSPVGIIKVDVQVRLLFCYFSSPYYALLILT